MSTCCIPPIPRYSELHSLEASVRAGAYAPALQWCGDKREILRKRGKEVSRIPSAGVPTADVYNVPFLLRKTTAGIFAKQWEIQYKLNF